jgi:hypothetical protein
MSSICNAQQFSVRAAATAIAAEGVISSVCGDHESAADQSDNDLRRMRRKAISPARATENEGQADSHERQYARRAMPAESTH